MIEILCHDGAAEVLCPPEQAGGFEQAAGTGTIHCYSLIDGVSAMLMRLEMQSYTEVRTQPGLLELNFCVDGRFETRFSLRDQVLLKPGSPTGRCGRLLFGQADGAGAPSAGSSAHRPGGGCVAGPAGGGARDLGVALTETVQ